MVAHQPVVKVIPEPFETILGNDYCVLPKNIDILVDSSFYDTTNEIELLQSLLEKIPGTYAEILFDKTYLLNNQFRVLIIKDTLSINPEEYTLDIDKKGITISASRPSGLFYAVQTFRQIAFANKTRVGTVELPHVSIHDRPRFPFRALMLDPARHFLTVPELESYIDAMAMYKYNRLHLHLTDDQGWRVEINSLPQLTQIGSVRSETQGDGKVHKGYYTQEQLKYVVQYAADRHIEIIPEVDIPGHSIAALAAFPRLSCNQKLLKVATTLGASKELLCAGNQQVYDFFEIIIEELAPIFPSKHFHIGGDEVSLDSWHKCQRCQRVIKDKKLKDEHELMSYFLNRIDSILIRYGKEPMFWYELNIPQYPANSTMYLWRLNTADEVIKKACNNGYKLVCTPCEHACFNYPQWVGDIPATNWMPVLSLQQSYDFEPTRNLPAGHSHCIIGIEACVWGEYIPNIERALYMTWPRALAMSEAGWTEKQNRNWNNFKDKLNLHLDYLLRHGINYRVPAELYKENEY
jgi:hexosaminidase